MDIINIKNPELFKEKLSHGINLFTGAGFSCLPDTFGNCLPMAKELSREVCDTFKLSDEFINDLESLSALAPKDLYQDFLRQRFTVSSYNPLYDILNKINILSYITTNIDNIIHCVVDKSSRYYMKSVTYYGSTRNTPNELFYIPLHGDVKNIDSRLYFGKFDLAVVDQANSDLFQLAHSRLLTKPTLFWGYGFHDNGVLRTVNRLLQEAPHDIWVQCMPEDNISIRLFQELGCNVIVSDTLSLLQWINTEIKDISVPEKTNKTINELKEYRIPTINTIESIPVTEYYQSGITHWHPILAKQAVELPIVNEAYNLALKHKNVMLIGGRFTGKTTILMQIALKVEIHNKFYVEKITPEQAKFIVKHIDNEQAWVFFHDCAEDIESYIIFSKCPNINIVGVTEDYHYESVRHLLSNTQYEYQEISELSRRDAQNIYDRIPASIRWDSFTYKESQDEKFSMLEMVSLNVRNVLTRARIRRILNDICRMDKQTFDAIALTSYLSNNGSMLSIDVIFPFFGINTYDQAQVIIKKSKSMLRQYEGILEEDEFDQDFFVLRSKLFSFFSDQLLRGDGFLKKEYARIIKSFIEKVPFFRIFRFDIFRRSAYDANLFAHLFGKEANQIYSMLYGYDKNPYTLQQWALCRAKFGEFAEAFVDIDNAINRRPNNFSMKNSRAIIMFEANKKQGTELAISKMKDSMDILQECYLNDKRKIYHAQKFAEFALLLYSKHTMNDYIKKAFKWISEISDYGGSSSHKTRILHKQLKQIVRRIDNQ